MVYVTGDLHGGMDIQKLRDWDPDRAPTRSDYLIAAGDFGHLWDFSSAELEEVACPQGRPYTVLFVDGKQVRYKDFLMSDLGESERLAA